jgi:glycoprotein endo-alpha-1,2-mannosidase
MDGDCVQDKYLHEIIKTADIVSPWTVDRYNSLEGATYIAEHIWKKDIAWCEENNAEFMPVVFPGFSWGNLNPGEEYYQIPRRKGTFLWQQLYEAINIGVKMIYQAMYDEVNEGTAIFKCTNNVPVGKSTFINYEGLPSDYYLKLLGEGAKMLRKETKLTSQLPKI